MCIRDSSTLRRLPSLAPMLVGAGAGAMINRRDTRKLAAQIRSDLRGRPPADPGYWTAADPPPDLTMRQSIDGL